MVLGRSSVRAGIAAESVSTNGDWPILGADEKWRRYTGLQDAPEPALSASELTLLSDLDQNSFRCTFTRVFGWVRDNSGVDQFTLYAYDLTTLPNASAADFTEALPAGIPMIMTLDDDTDGCYVTLWPAIDGVA